MSNNIDASGSNINANGRVEMVGGNSIKIGGSVYNIDVSPPSGGSLANYQTSLETNRKTVKEDLKDLENLIAKGVKLNDSKIIAVITDAASGINNIQQLIRTIKLNGGKAKSLPSESDIARRINEAIIKGVERFEKGESSSDDAAGCLGGIYMVIAIGIGYFISVPEFGMIGGIAFAAFWPIVLIIVLFLMLVGAVFG